MFGKWGIGLTLIVVPYSFLYGIVSRLPMIYAMIHMRVFLQLTGMVPACLFAAYCLGRLCGASFTSSLFGIHSMMVGTCCGVVSHLGILAAPADPVVFGTMIALAGLTETVTGINIIMKLECILQGIPKSDETRVFRCHFVSVTAGAVGAYLGGGALYDAFGIDAIAWCGLLCSAVQVMVLLAYAIPRRHLYRKCVTRAKDVMAEAKRKEKPNDFLDVAGGGGGSKAREVRSPVEEIEHAMSAFLSEENLAKQDRALSGYKGMPDDREETRTKIRASVAMRHSALTASMSNRGSMLRGSMESHNTSSQPVWSSAGLGSVNTDIGSVIRRQQTPGSAGPVDSSKQKQHRHGMGHESAGPNVSNGSLGSASASKEAGAKASPSGGSEGCGSSSSIVHGVSGVSSHDSRDKYYETMSYKKQHKVNLTGWTIVLSYFITAFPIGQNFALMTLYWKYMWGQDTAVAGMIMSLGEVLGLVALVPMASKAVFESPLFASFRKPMNLVLACGVSSAMVALAIAPDIYASAFGCVSIHVVNVMLHTFCNEICAAWIPPDVYAKWTGRCYLAKRLSNTTIAFVCTSIFTFVGMRESFIMISSIVGAWTVILAYVFWSCELMPWQAEHSKKLEDIAVQQHLQTAVTAGAMADMQLLLETLDMSRMTNAQVEKVESRLKLVQVDVAAIMGGLKLDVYEV